MRIALYLSMAALLVLGSNIAFSQEAGKDAKKEDKPAASAPAAAPTTSTSGTATTTK